MAEPIDVFNEMKSFIDFNEKDAQNLVALQDTFAKHGPKITDNFYEVLGKYDTTAAFLEGRVEALKATHARWMSELLNGQYGEDYFNSRQRIGQVHVKIGLPAYWVEAVMTVIRVGGHDAITKEFDDPQQVADLYESLVKILDLDLLIINLAYSEERLNRMCKITGMSRKLVERLINQADK